MWKLCNSIPYYCTSKVTPGKQFFFHNHCAKKLPLSYKPQFGEGWVRLEVFVKLFWLLIEYFFLTPCYWNVARMSGYCIVLRSVKHNWHRNSWKLGISHPIKAACVFLNENFSKLQENINNRIGPVLCSLKIHCRKNGHSLVMGKHCKRVVKLLGLC